jgi:hypothetical protein
MPHPSLAMVVMFRRCLLFVISTVPSDCGAALKSTLTVFLSVVVIATSCRSDIAIYKRVESRAVLVDLRARRMQETNKHPEGMNLMHFLAYRRRKGGTLIFRMLHAANKTGRFEDH